ncbi:TdeIII family type II restriction endonuclease [Planctomycetota bacterium]
MSMDSVTRRRIRSMVSVVVRGKLRGYDPETYHKPFHDALMGAERCAVFSFVHSMNTVMGMSIWRQVAVVLAEAAGYEAEINYDLLGDVDSATERLIARIHRDLVRERESPDVDAETEQIRASISPADGDSHPDRRAGLFIRRGGREHYILVKTAKPNKGEFISWKLKLLNLKALRLSQNSSAQVSAAVGIPYNPYHPNPYDRWTRGSLYDEAGGELLVGSELWNFVADDDVYEDLLGVFEDVGRSLRSDIADKFRAISR